MQMKKNVQIAQALNNQRRKCQFIYKLYKHSWQHFMRRAQLNNRPHRKAQRKDFRISLGCIRTNTYRATKLHIKNTLSSSIWMTRQTRMHAYIRPILRNIKHPSCHSQVGPLHNKVTYSFWPWTPMWLNGLCMRTRSHCGQFIPYAQGHVVHTVWEEEGRGQKAFEPLLPWPCGPLLLVHSLLSTASCGVSGEVDKAKVSPYWIVDY